jgi:hypothetical protein
VGKARKRRPKALDCGQITAAVFSDSNKTAKITAAQLGPVPWIPDIQFSACQHTVLTRLSRSANDIFRYYFERDGDQFLANSLLIKSSCHSTT